MRISSASTLREFGINCLNLDVLFETDGLRDIYMYRCTHIQVYRYMERKKAEERNTKIYIFEFKRERGCCISSASSSSSTLYTEYTGKYAPKNSLRFISSSVLLYELNPTLKTLEKQTFSCCL